MKNQNNETLSIGIIWNLSRLWDPTCSTSFCTAHQVTLGSFPFMSTKPSLWHGRWKPCGTNLCAYPTFLPIYHPNCSESTNTVFRAHKTGRRVDADNFYVTLVFAKILQLYLLLYMHSPQVAYNRSQALCWPNDPSTQHRNDHWPCVCTIWLGRQGRMWQYEWLQNHLQRIRKITFLWIQMEKQK